MRIDEALDRVHRNVIQDFKSGYTQLEQSRVEEYLENLVAAYGWATSSKAQQAALLQIARVVLREASESPKNLISDGTMSEYII